MKEVALLMGLTVLGSYGLAIIASNVTKKEKDPLRDLFKRMKR